MEELARGEANTLGEAPETAHPRQDLLGALQEVADMIQDSNNYHAKHLRESPVEAFVDWKVERKIRLANETLKVIPLTPKATIQNSSVNTTTIAPFHRCGLAYTIYLTTSHPHVIDGDRLTHRPQAATTLEYSMRHAVDWTRTAPPL